MTTSSSHGGGGGGGGGGALPSPPPLSSPPSPPLFSVSFTGLQENVVEASKALNDYIDRSHVMTEPPGIAYPSTHIQLQEIEEAVATLLVKGHGTLVVEDEGSSSSSSGGVGGRIRVRALGELHCRNLKAAIGRYLQERALDDHLPPSWVNKDRDRVELVPLPPQTPEYDEVETRVTASFACQV